VGTSRALGALLCIVCVVIAVAHIFYGYYMGPTPHLAFALPVTVGVLLLAGLGVWLGWIMASTKEISPVPAPAPSVVENEPESEPESEKKKK